MSWYKDFLIFSIICKLLFIRINSLMIPLINPIPEPNYVVSIHNDYRICSGVLIHPGWVLLARHCTINQKPEAFAIHVGYSTIGYVSDIISRPDYNRYSLVNDLSLLKLIVPFLLSDVIGTIVIASNVPKIGTSVQINMLKGKTERSALYKYQHMVVENKECEKEWIDTESSEIFCTQNMDSEMQSNCTDTLEGSIVYEGELIGLVSNVVNCEKTITVNADVTIFKEWINYVRENYHEDKYDKNFVKNDHFL